jgi:hypothetical protein
MTGVVCPGAGRIVLEVDGRSIDLVGRAPEEIVGLGIATCRRGGG